jgi:hypothetical protein
MLSGFDDEFGHCTAFDLISNTNPLTRFQSLPKVASPRSPPQPPSPPQPESVEAPCNELTQFSTVAEAVCVTDRNNRRVYDILNVIRHLGVISQTHAGKRYEYLGTMTPNLSPLQISTEIGLQCAI